MKLSIKHLLIFIFIFASVLVYGSHKVYVIHGWANPKAITTKIHRYIDKAGYISENYAYPALMVDLDSLGKHLYTHVKTQDFDSVSFVTYSMGALVFRNMLKYSCLDFDFPKIHKIVMISPPNQGADIADFFKGNKKWKGIIGPNVEKMETDSLSYANRLPVPIDVELGVIVGIRGKKKGYNPWIDGANDGMLKPERALLGNETDTAILKINHGALTQRRKSLNRVVRFLKYSCFECKKQVIP